METMRDHQTLPHTPLLLAALLLTACDPTKDTGGEPTDTADTADTAEPVVEGCHATPQPADRERVVLVSLPYDADGAASKVWAALTLSTEGELRDDGARVEMGRAWSGEVVFTPDANHGYAVQDDGTIGVFAVEDGVVTVLDAGWDGGVYAVRAVMDPSGETLWVIDGNWPVNGGGLYAAPIDCATGELGEPTLVAAAKLPADLLLLDESRAALIGREVEGADEGEDVSLLSWPEGARVAGVDAFGDDEAIVSDAASLDGLLLVADYSEFSGVSTRVAAVRVDGDALEAAQILDVEDPVALVASPWGDQVLVVSGYGDALLQVPVDLEASEPLGEPSELDYSGGRPQLPGAAALLRRGPLRGLVLVTETEGIRAVQLGPDGAAEDLGLTSLGASYEGITGAVGVQP